LSRARSPSGLQATHYRRNDMNLILLLVVGGFLGWLASIIMKTNDQQGMILNIVVGVAGALLAGYVLAPMLGSGTINSGDFSLASLLVSLIGAVVLLAIVSMFRRGRQLR
jgi:uncharacterized membrane protein YeaQ/YmgE (transglycosylase-associated protein family)